MLCVGAPVCSGIVVQNLAAAQRLKGCTIIKGVLEIQILGGCEYMNRCSHKRSYSTFGLLFSQTYCRLGHIPK